MAYKCLSLCRFRGFTAGFCKNFVQRFQKFKVRFQGKAKNFDLFRMRKKFRVQVERNFPTLSHERFSIVEPIVQFEKLLGNIIVFINGVAGGFFCLLHRYFVGLDFLRLRHIILDFFKDFSLLFGLGLAEIFEKIIGNVQFLAEEPITETGGQFIRNVNADAVFAVYPFTPQPIITQALLMASDLPVFVGVGGGLTTGKRVVNLAMYAEMQGATGVVVNAPTPGRILNRIRSSVDVPVVVTVANSDTNYRHRIEDGAAILNVAAGAQTPEIVAEIRERFPDYPIIATGGADEQSIRATIRAGANAIVWTPPSSAELFRDVMKNYREGKPHP